MQLNRMIVMDYSLSIEWNILRLALARESFELPCSSPPLFFRNLSIVGRMKKGNQDGKERKNIQGREGEMRICSP